MEAVRISNTLTEVAELLFVPSPGAGHIFPMLELAEQLVNRDPRLAVTFCLMKMPFQQTSHDFKSSSGRIRFVELEPTTLDPDTPRSIRFTSFIDGHAPQIRDIASKTASSSRLAGFVLDMFCTSFIDVANELGAPSYVFYTCGATCLGFMLHVQSLFDKGEFDPAELKDSDAELAIPGLRDPLQGKQLPSVVVEADWLPTVMRHTRRTREAKGILVNTFHDFESQAVASLTTGQTPPLYTVGPIIDLKLKKGDTVGEKEIVDWLDQQPKSSVVFLCFGSLASLDEEQVTEIAAALEASGQRFLWSLRKPPQKGKPEFYPSDYDDVKDGLPEGFMDRTAGLGKVIGWAPQTRVLAHPSMGGFVSHCGWNSTLESTWFGVPVATWPMQAEQQLNAVMLVKELEMAVEIRMSYRKLSGEVVPAEEIERGMRGLMAAENEGRRIKVKEMSDKCRKAVEEDGSSYHSVGRFIEDVISNTP
ncbi:unnamed protein product [Linum trigynum]|uniref:anthocyanidin 3-O-glucosyltransferase n=2 Tax=Linum trigynum TaxID=586398 RepID=A0AAV2G133_9ROSI